MTLTGVSGLVSNLIRLRIFPSPDIIKVSYSGLCSNRFLLRIVFSSEGKASYCDPFRVKLVIPSQWLILSDGIREIRSPTKVFSKLLEVMGKFIDKVAVMGVGDGEGSRMGFVWSVEILSCSALSFSFFLNSAMRDFSFSAW